LIELPGKLVAKDDMDVSEGNLIDVDKEILTMDTKLLFKSLKFNNLTKIL